MSFVIELIAVIAAIAATIYFFVKKRFNYWEERGIPYVKPSFPFGTLDLKNTKHYSVQVQEEYAQFKDKPAPFYGVFQFFTPILTATDLDFVKTILMRDSFNFTNNGTYSSIKEDPLAGNMFSAQGERWKALRTTFTPAFTPGKMKFLFPTVADISQRFVDQLVKELKVSDELEFTELALRFTTDVSGSTAFGLEINSLDDPNTEFKRIGKELTEYVLFIPRMLFTSTFPGLSKFLKIRFFPERVGTFFVQVVKDLIEYRERSNEHRKDIMEIMISMRNKNKSNDEKDESMEGLSMNEIAAQAALFFVGSFNSSALTLAYAVLELAMNPELQETARKSVKDVLKRHEGKFTYEAVQEMGYVEQCVNETLRLYPVVPIMTRVAENDYKVPGFNFTIPKNTPVKIPISAFHHDPDFFPEPYKFDPDRFSPEQSAQRQSCTFMPFGEGPRLCIGYRFGLMQIKCGLAYLLNNFKFKPTEKTQYPVKFTASLVPEPQNGIHLRFECI